MRNVVVLPAPFGPSNPKISPRCTVNDVLATAVKSPKVLTKSLTTMTAWSDCELLFCSNRKACSEIEICCFDFAVTTS